MKEYFDDMGRFQYHNFLSDLLTSIDNAIEIIFGGKDSIKKCGSLRRITKNKSYSCKKCRRENSGAKRKALFTQCADCMVAVSQTKMGACVQLQWQGGRDNFPGSKTYCSIDLVPIMRISPVEIRVVIQ